MASLPPSFLQSLGLANHKVPRAPKENNPMAGDGLLYLKCNLVRIQQSLIANYLQNFTKICRQA
jgi:hypothetical protein